MSGIERSRTVVAGIPRSEREEKVEAVRDVPIKVFVRSHDERRSLLRNNKLSV